MDAMKTIFARRLRSALKASSIHLIGSFFVALLCGGLIFGIWYPYPFSELVGGKQLFLLAVSVDVVAGPLLTLVVFNPAKRKLELWRDIGTIVALQLAALGYGIFSMAEARPVFVAFEGSRFRVVCIPDIDHSALKEAPKALQRLSWSGPKMLGVRLAKSTDPDFLASIEMSLKGFHSAFRPGRWVSYDSQREDVSAAVKPLSLLREKHPQQKALIERVLAISNLNEKDLGYLPLAAGAHDDWVLVVRVKDAEPVAYLPLDGW